MSIKLAFKKGFQRAAGPVAELVADVLVFVLGGVAILSLDWGLDLLIDLARPHAPNVVIVYVAEGLGYVLLLTDVVLFVYLLWVSAKRTAKEIKEKGNG